MSTSNVARAIQDGDMERLWEALYSLVSSNPAVLAHAGAMEQSSERLDWQASLTQDVVLQLLSGDRLDVLASIDDSSEVDSDIAANELHSALSALLDVG